MIKSYKLFIESNHYPIMESNKAKLNVKNLIQEICVAMILLNNEFLDNILDKGLKARYTENTTVFLTDLKNLILAKNRLSLGKFEGDKCVTDEEDSKINGIFESVKFNIDTDWMLLVDSRIIARNIIDKLLVDEKLTEDKIKKVWWLGPNKDKDVKEDLVIELTDGRQFSLFLNKSLSISKSSSFMTFADDLIGENIDKLFSEEYIKNWNKLIRNWIRIIYENSNKNIQVHIEKFIDPKRIDSIGWFEFFSIKHGDPRYKYLGEHIKEFDKNILYLHDLLKEVWKSGDLSFMDFTRVYKEWLEVKNFLLNSRTLEHLLTQSLIENNFNDVKKLPDGWKRAYGKVKMKLVKTIVDKIGAIERPVYFLGNKGNQFNLVPNRQFFRDFYDDIDVKFDYHVKMVINEEDEEENNFKIGIRMEIDDKDFIECQIRVHFTGGDVSTKLSAKYNFTIPSDFNLIVSNKMKGIKE